MPHHDNRALRPPLPHRGALLSLRAATHLLNCHAPDGGPSWYFTPSLASCCSRVESPATTQQACEEIGVDMLQLRFECVLGYLEEAQQLLHPAPGFTSWRLVSVPPHGRSRDRATLRVHIRLCVCALSQGRQAWNNRTSISSFVSRFSPACLSEATPTRTGRQCLQASNTRAAAPTYRFATTTHSCTQEHGREDRCRLRYGRGVCLALIDVSRGVSMLSQRA